MSDEEQPTEQPEEVKEPPKAPEQIDPANLIEKAEQAAKRLENANKEYAKLLTRQEALAVEKTLGGQTTAGKQETSPEEKATAEAKKMLEGTGFEDMFDTPK